MNEVELKNLWTKYDERLDKVIAFNEQMMEEVMKQKARSSLAGARPFKIWGILIGVPWVIVLAFLTFIGVMSGNPFFACSLLAILICTIVALGTYIHHLVLINQVNVSTSILEAQEKIAEIKVSTLRSTRIVFLQLPFWTTWYLQVGLLQGGHSLYWTVNVLVTLLFVALTIWLYRNIRVERLGSKWIKWLFSDEEWNAVNRASDILNQINEMNQ